MATIGVGLLGAGPVVQAIHLPTLARIQDRLTVRTIMDIDPVVAASVAARVGARPVTSVEELLADPLVEVVAICSPSQFHAEQVIAAMRAGKKAVLCEKPFAVDRAEAERIAQVSVETGVPVIVGAMHTFDPGWIAVAEAWGDLPQTAHTIRSRIQLPPNARFEDFATEVITRPELGAPDLTDPAVRAAMIAGGVLGLAIHDLPLVRAFVPDATLVRVTSGHVLRPFGYLIDLVAAGRTVQLVGVLDDRWEPDWTFQVLSDEAELMVRFTPSYVQAGSATAVLRHGGETRVFGPFDHNGYEGEWRILADIVEGDRSHAPSLETLVDDLVFAVTIAEAAADATRKDAA
jgi:predicted dehydrogenase